MNDTKGGWGGILGGIAAIIVAIGGLGLFQKQEPEAPNVHVSPAKPDAMPATSPRENPSPAPKPSIAQGSEPGRYFAKISEDDDCPAQMRVAQELEAQKQYDSTLAPFTFAAKRFKDDPDRCAVVVGEGPKGKVSTLIGQWDALHRDGFSSAQRIRVEKFSDL